MDQDSLLNKETSIAGDMRDAIGLTMSKDRFTKLKMSEVDVMGLVCSSNKINGMTRPTST